MQRTARHQESYLIHFTPGRDLSRVVLEIPAAAITVDVAQTRKVFQAGPSIETYDQVWDIVRGV